MGRREIWFSTQALTQKVPGVQQRRVVQGLDRLQQRVCGKGCVVGAPSRGVVRSRGVERAKDLVETAKGDVFEHDLVGRVESFALGRRARWCFWLGHELLILGHY